MRIIGKLVRRIVLAALALLILIGIILYFNLNRIVRRTIEVQATASLDVPTTLGSARLSLFGGSFGMSDFQVGSPQGFSAPHMLTLASGDVTVNYSQLRSQPIHISTITLDRPTLIVEQAGGKLNLKALMDRPEKTSPNEIRLIIDTLTVKNASVAFRPGLPGLEKEILVPIPSLELKNIGTGEGNQNGVAIKQVVLQTATALAERAGQGNLPKELQALLNTNLNSITQQLTSEAQKRLGNLAKPLDDVLKSKDLTNLLPTDKKQPKKK